MNKLRKLVAIALFSGCLAGGQSAYAAQANVTVDLDLPTILVMYHWSTINVSVSQAVLGDYLAGVGTGCGAGDVCDDQGTLVGPLVIADLTAATVDAGIDDTILPANGPATITIQNAVGVRALGCATYDTVLADGGSDAGITVNGTTVTGIEGAGCSMTTTMGDLDFDVDFTAVTTDPVSAVFDVTITGV